MTERKRHESESETTAEDAEDAEDAEGGGVEDSFMGRQNGRAGRSRD